jgi:hypothetical protein
VPAGVVHYLEAIEIEVAEHVRRLAAPRRFGRLVEAALELAPVHEAGERVVRRLVGHLPVQTTQLGHVVQQDYGANEFVIDAQRRCGELDGALFPRGLAEQHRPATQIVRIAIPAADGFFHRIRQQLAIVLVHEADDFLERPPQRLRAADAQQQFRGRIEIHQQALEIRRDDRLGQRLHGEHLQRRRWRRQRRRDQRGARRSLLLVDPAARERAQLFRRDHLDTGHEQRRRSLEIDLCGS